MFGSVLEVLQAFFGRRAGKSIAGIAIVFGLGVGAAYFLPTYLVTVATLNAEIVKVMEQSQRSDTWQELNVMELRKEIAQKQLYDLEDRLDGTGVLTLKQKQRLKFIETTLRKIDDRIDEIHEQLKTVKGAK